MYKPMETKYCTIYRYLEDFSDGEDIILERWVSFVPSKGSKNTLRQRDVIRIQNALKDKYDNKSLDVSTYSNSPIGRACATFNLKMNGASFEAVYQSSKVYKDKEEVNYTNYSKKELRKMFYDVPDENDVIGYFYDGKEYINYDNNLFYDYLYCKFLDFNKDIDREELFKYDTYFSCDRSTSDKNSPCHSICLYRFFYKFGLLEEALSSYEKFKSCYINNIKNYMRSVIL